MQSISKIKRASFAGALDALDQLITTRLVPDLNAVMETDQVKSWLEKALVMYTNLCVNAPEDDKSRALEKMPQLLDQMFERTCDLLSPKATHAMQALIWKASNDAQGSEAQVWLSLLQHSIFVTIGAANKARIIRKVMLDALGRDEIETARAAFHQLPAPAQNEGMTRYLAFKLALKSTDSGLASECLEALAKDSNKDQRYLYACVLEAQNSGNRRIAVAAFHALANQPSKGTHLPALLRCTAKLLMQELESLSRDLPEVTGEIVRVFEVAATNTRAFRQTTEELWRAEIQWWSKNSFNLALQLCTEMHPEHLIRLLRACGKFLECYPDDDGLMHRDDLLHRKQICQFLCASAFMVLARSATNAEEQLQGYLEVQREAKTFLATWQQPHHSTADAEIQCARAFELLRYNVESVFKLQQWDKLDEALASCLNFRSTARWEALADLVIVIYDQTSTLAIDSSATARIPELLQKIINETWKNEKDTQKLARWLRFTFSIDLDSINGSMSVTLVEQAASMARRGTEMRHDPYPEDELQWLATTAFNKAVDFLTSGEHQATEQWMEAALDLARYAADNGSLHALLTRNREEAEKRMGGR